jgi:tetratricopeptide (TPR) repeat protein
VIVRKSLFPLIVLVALGGCATGLEHRALLDAGAPVELADAPFFPQDDYQCGPAALATVLVAAGIDVTPEQLTPQVYVPGRRGTLQAELLAATRRHGRVPYLLPHTLTPLLEEVRSGRPVLVFQNLGLERWPVWHYAVLIGFDPDREQFLLRSGTESRLRTRARPFLASWDRAGRWSMVAAAPSEPPAGADVLGWLQAVAPFESTGEYEIAAVAYEAAIQRWPHAAAAWTALGNVRYRQQRLNEAADAYLHALDQSADHWVARNNLVRTLITLGCPSQAQTWADGAGTPPTALATTWADTLSRLEDAGADSCAYPK